MNSGNKYLLLISASPKIASSLFNDKADALPPELPGVNPSVRSQKRLFGVTEIEGGFPHSEILGSKPVRGSPRLIAAYHVLHRLSAPRHPPDTLKTLDCSHCQSAVRKTEDGRQRTEKAQAFLSSDLCPPASDAPWREKTSFASNASGDLSGQAPNPRL